MKQKLVDDRRVVGGLLTFVRPVYEKPAVLTYHEQDLLEQLGPVRACNSPNLANCRDFINEGFLPVP